MSLPRLEREQLEGAAVSYIVRDADGQRLGRVYRGTVITWYAEREAFGPKSVRLPARFKTRTEAVKALETPPV
jgi:hypothetical protein